MDESKDIGLNTGDDSKSQNVSSPDDQDLMIDQSRDQGRKIDEFVLATEKPDSPRSKSKSKPDSPRSKRKSSQKTRSRSHGRRSSRSGKRERSRSAKRAHSRSGKRAHSRSGKRTHSRSGKQTPSRSQKSVRSRSGRGERSRSPKREQSRKPLKSSTRSPSRSKKSKSGRSPSRSRKSKSKKLKFANVVPDVDEYVSARYSRILTDRITRRPCLAALLPLSFCIMLSLVWASGILEAGINETGGTALAYDELDTRRYFALLTHSHRALDDENVEVPVLSQSISDLSIFYKSDDSDNIFTKEGLKAIWENERGVIGLSSRGDQTIKGYGEHCAVKEGIEVSEVCSDLTGIDHCAPPLSPLSIFFPGSYDLGCVLQCRYELYVCTLDAQCNEAYPIVPQKHHTCILGINSPETCWRTHNDYQESDPLPRTNASFAGINPGNKTSFGLFEDYWDCLVACGTDYYNITEAMIDELEQSQIDLLLTLIPEVYGYFVDQNFHFMFENNTHLRSKLTRSSFYLGAPLCGTDENGDRLYNNNVHKIDEQEDAYVEWARQYTEFFSKPDPEGIELSYFSNELSMAEVADDLNSDFILAATAGIVIFVFIGIQTKSLFLSLCAFVNIMIAYPTSLFFYHGVLRIQLDTALNRLSIFMILGIGADDIFVFTDTWKQSAHQPDWVTESIERRLNWVWRRAAKAMAITSFTTFFAFMMTSISPLPVVETFGVFSSLMVLINYIMVITWYPACIILWHTKIKEIGCIKKMKYKMGKNTGDKPPRPMVKQESARDFGYINITKYRKTDRFFYATFVPIMYKFRYYLASIFAVVFILAVVGTSRLKPEQYSEQPWPHDSDAYISVFDYIPKYKISSGGPSGGIHIFWGINSEDPVDVTGLDRNDESNHGAINIDETFGENFNIQNQDRLIQICEELKTAKTPSGDLFVVNDEVECFMEEFQEYEANTYGDRTSGHTEISRRIWQWLNVTNKEGGFINRHWLSYIGVTTTTPKDGIIPLITYADVRVKSNMNIPESLDEYKVWGGLWKDLMKKLNSESDVGLDNGFPTAMFFSYYVTQEVLVKATVNSLVVSYFVAVVCLVIASRNVVVAGLASLCIGGVVFTLIGALTVSGFGLDIINSVIYVMLVGLAVDYVVHISSAYNECLADGRYVRARIATLEMGTSVLSGAITTMTATGFLLAAKYEFFKLFARNVLSLIFISIVWTLFCFVPLLMIFGPKRTPHGDISYIVAKCWNKYRKRSPPPSVVELAVKTPSKRGKEINGTDV